MTLLLLNGLGDAISILQHIPSLPTSITLATPAAAIIGELCYLLKIPITILDSSRVYHWKSRLESSIGPLDCEEGCVSRCFPLIDTDEWTFQRSLFENMKFPR